MIKKRVARKPFNTVFEASLRVMLILDAFFDRALSVDMIAYIDFICTYGQIFGLADKNLHGDNTFTFCEFTNRREIVTKAIKSLVLDGKCVVTNEKNGFCYGLSDNGKTAVIKFNSEYATEYRMLSKAAKNYIGNQSEQGMLTLISEQAKNLLQEGDYG